MGEEKATCVWKNKKKYIRPVPDAEGDCPDSIEYDDVDFVLVDTPDKCPKPGKVTEC